MTTWVPQCFICKHYKGAMRCVAYPDAIPTPIWMNDVVHDKPHDGDHGIQFESKPKKSWKGFY